MILVSEVQKAVADLYGLPVAVMRAPDGMFGIRERRFARPRQVAIYLASCLTAHSYVRIGQLFGGRDHSTILWAISSVKRRLADNADAQDEMRRIAHRILAGGDIA